MTISSLIQKFQTVFKTNQSPEVFFAPGRINLIGEHTDYNGGHVLPAPLSLGTYVLGQKRTDQKFRFYSLNFFEPGIIECNLSDLSFNALHDWANYPKGIIHFIQTTGHQFSQGADLLFYGNIPNGAGLSSSASVEIATGVLLDQLFDIGINRGELVKLGQKVENEYIGVNSGIMDQFAIGMGKENHAILLNCHSLEHKYVPISLDEHVIMIINSNKQRTLAGSKYNERRSQCEQALKDLQTTLPIHSLGELTTVEFEQYNYLIKSDLNRKRARHVVYENARTLEAFEKLQQNDLVYFGNLMNESHLSLQQNYEVTGTELDTIVNAAWDQPGVLGARMTGAGFGGCAIALVAKDKVEAFKENIGRIYQKRIGYRATFYTANIGNGAKQVTEGVC